MRSWSESDRAPDDPCHAVDRGVGDPVEFVASIKHNAPGVNRRAVSNAQTSLALTAVRCAAALAGTGSILALLANAHAWVTGLAILAVIGASWIAWANGSDATLASRVHALRDGGGDRSVGHRGALASHRAAGCARADGVTMKRFDLQP